ncbi:MAG TPA: YggT family protein [Deltaproteobacteria bacterium]|nr:YggT family protein [Deltaproteobacteria bacterium]
MIVLGNFLVALGGVVHTTLSLASLVLIARVLFSWFRPNPPAGLLRTLVSAVYRLTDPVLDRTREWLPFLQIGGLDLSPIAVFVAISFLDRFLTGSLTQLGYGML